MDDKKIKSIVERKHAFAERRAARGLGLVAGREPQGSGPANRHGMPRLQVGQHEVTTWPVLDLGDLPDIAEVLQHRLSVVRRSLQPVSLAARAGIVLQWSRHHEDVFPAGPDARRGQAAAADSESPPRILDRQLVEVLSSSLEAVVKEKARAAYRATMVPLLVEHGALYIDHPDGFPGPMIKLFREKLRDRLPPLIPAGASRRCAPITASDRAIYWIKRLISPAAAYWPPPETTLT